MYTYIFDCSIGQNRTEKLLTDKQEIGSNEMQIIQYWTEDKKKKLWKKIKKIKSNSRCFRRLYLFFLYIHRKETQKHNEQNDERKTRWTKETDKVIGMSELDWRFDGGTTKFSQTIQNII